MKKFSNIKAIGAWALVSALAANLALADNPNPKIHPLNSKPYGKTYSQWAGVWWQWAYGTPLEINPVTDSTGQFAAVGQSGPVWLLAGTWSSSSEPVTRTVTVPTGKALFFPIINTIWVNLPELGDNPWSDEERDLARSQIAPAIDSAYDLACEIDGVAVVNIGDYRCQTADGSEYMVTFPEDNMWWPLQAGTYGPSVDDGIYLMLTPLPAGKHTIHFTAKSVFQGTATSLDVTYHLKVGK